MYATLYLPDQAPKPFPVGGFGLPDNRGKGASGAREAALALECAPRLVDVLANGTDYTAFSVFDHEGSPNLEAMRVLSELTGVSFNPADDDELLRGPVLIVRH